MATCIAPPLVTTRGRLHAGERWNGYWSPSMIGNARRSWRVTGARPSWAMSPCGVSACRRYRLLALAAPSLPQLHQMVQRDGENQHQRTQYVAGERVARPVLTFQYTRGTDEN